jgi:hypothetical protein
MRSTGSGPFKVRLGDERHAAGLAQELKAIDGISVERDDPWWEVVIDGAVTDRLVVSVLDGLRRTLAGEPTATACVVLDGREYQFESE